MTAAAAAVGGPMSVCRVGHRLVYWAVGCGSCCKPETLVLALVQGYSKCCGYYFWFGKALSDYWRRTAKDEKHRSALQLCLLVPMRYSKLYSCTFNTVTGVFVGWMLPVPVAISKCLMEYKEVSSKGPLSRQWRRRD